MASEGPRRSQRTTKGTGPTKYGWKQAPESASQVTRTHKSTSSRHSSSRALRQRHLETELEAA